MPPIPTHPFLDYTPTFLPPQSSASLFTHIHTSAQPPWTTLSHRRLQSHPTRLTSSDVLLPAPLPAHLARLVPDVLARAGIAPNHVLVNEYLPGQGILPHEDGAAYRPVVATVSLGSAAVVEFWPKKDKNGDDDGGEGEGKGKVRVLMEVGSLLVTKDEGYTDYLHGIPETLVDEDLGPDTIANWDLLGDKGAFGGGRNVRGTRISLTYRNVIKVAKVGGVVFGKRR